MFRKPNRKLNRLKNYNYTQDGYYFVTICTKNREEFFGQIGNVKIGLNEFGKMARKYWLEIPNHFPNVKSDEFVIMPNHIHGILIIDNNNAFNKNNGDGVGNDGDGVGNADLRSLRGLRSLQYRDRTKMYLSKIIHGFKSSVTREIRKKFENSEFAWQKSFYDHIIRNEKSLFNIRQYIINNPKNWELEKDRNHSVNID